MENKCLNHDSDEQTENGVLGKGMGDEETNVDKLTVIGNATNGAGGCIWIVRVRAKRGLLSMRRETGNEFSKGQR